MFVKIGMVGVEIGRSGGSYVGGVVNSVIRLSRGLSERKHEIYLVTSPARFSTKKLKIDDWFSAHSLNISSHYPSLKYGFEFSIKALKKIRQLYKDDKIELINGHSGYAAIGIIPSLSRKIIGIPSIHTLYCPLYSEYEINPIFRIFQNSYLVKRILSSVDRIVAVSENVKISLQRIGIPDHKIVKIPLPVDTFTFSPTVSGKQLRRDLEINSDEVLILFVGNLTKTKGLDILIKSMKKIVETVQNVKLLIVLHQTETALTIETQNIQSLIESLRLTSNILFMGINDRMPEIVGACDLLVVPFRSTTGISDYPLIILEAMSSGKPVISTNVGGIPEIISENQTGVLIPPSDQEKLSQTIINLIINQDFSKKIGRDASKFVQSNFSYRIITQMTEKVYKELIET